MTEVLPGIWQFTLGQPEAFTPVQCRHRPPAAKRLQALTAPTHPPLEGRLSGQQTHRGFIVRLALTAEEHLYGLGLQLLSFDQRGTKKTLRVNSDPRVDLGDSHAPVPFYLSTAGYGVLIDTFRYATFYLGSADEVGRAPDRPPEVLVEIPLARGVTVYVFAGPEMITALQRYILFSGGGCLPPRWGLGPWYRCHLEFDQEQVVSLAHSLRADKIPCDVIGLEPGWQTHAYPCTFVWSERFPNPAAMIASLAREGFRVNLWTHAFVHPDSPLFAPLQNRCGNFRAFSGLVPDLALSEVRQLYAALYEREHVALGVSGYKLDECDNSDFTRPWSFPELSQFPSGLDGEQMHSAMGICYQETVEEIFRRRNQRTLGQVRSSHALAAPYPFVLYSDLYDHREFIRGVANCGFSGLLWSPEVRHAVSAEDLIRRLQSVVFSPQALINAWYIKHPPWKQWESEANNRGEFHPDWPAVQETCRELLCLRARLVPYLYAAFFRYWQEGIPPFRGLVLDWPEDENVWKIDDQYCVGDRLMAAPVIAGQQGRKVYLPAGKWFDFWSGEEYPGRQTLELEVPLEKIPLFVRGDSLLPLAGPALHAGDPVALELTVRVYGAGSQGIVLVEDDGITFAVERGAYNLLELTWDEQTQTGRARRQGKAEAPAYQVCRWEIAGKNS